MLKNKEKLMAVWLIPTKKDYDILHEIIKDLSKKFNSSCFEPHLTVYAAKASQIESYEYFSNYIAQIISPISLNIISLKHSSEFTKTLYITFGDSRKLLETTSKINKQFKSGISSYDPHLSLLYASTQKKNIEKLAKNIIIPIERVLFDKVKFIEAHIPVESNNDINSWKTIHEIQL